MRPHPLLMPRRPPQVRQFLLAVEAASWTSTSVGSSPLVDSVLCKRQRPNQRHQPLSKLLHLSPQTASPCSGMILSRNSQSQHLRQLLRPRLPQRLSLLQGPPSQAMGMQLACLQGCPQACQLVQGLVCQLVQGPACQLRCQLQCQACPQGYRQCSLSSRSSRCRRSSLRRCT